MQAAILFHRQEREVLHEGPGEEADPTLVRHAVAVIELDPLHAARRRLGLEDETAQLLLLQLRTRFCGPGQHACGDILPRTGEDQVRAIILLDQAQGLPRRRQPHLHLGADRHVIDVFTEGVAQEAVELMAAVITHHFAEQAAADSQADLVRHRDLFGSRLVDSWFEKRFYHVTRDHAPRAGHLICYSVLAATLAKDANVPVPALRIRAINNRPTNPDGRYILYWMIACRRTHWNFALQRAVERAANWASRW